MRNIRIAVCTALLMLPVGCTREKDEVPLATEGIDVPVQKVTETTLHFFNKGRIQWRLNAEHMSKPLSDTGSITLVPVQLTMYDSAGMVSTRVLSDSGIIRNKMESYFIWGNVFIRTRDSMVVRTESLRWFRERARVESDTFVQIETKKGDVLRGKGLDATEDFSRFSFKSDVTGKFPDFENRVEQDDASVF